MNRALAIAASFLFASSAGCSDVITVSSSTTGGNGAGGGGGTACVPVDVHDPCSDSLCDGGMLVHTAKPDGTMCGSADGCTVGGTCQAGVCMGAKPMVCNGGAVCVDGACVSPACTGTIGLPGTPQLPVGNS